MKHNLKFPDGTIKAVDCKLGSGVFDKNNREIFEDDRVNAKSWRVFDHMVDFNNGTFWADSYPLHEINPNELEIVND